MTGGYYIYTVSHATLLREARPWLSDLDRIMTIFWYIIGFTGNLLAGAVWLKRPMQENNSSAIYLAALAICDLLFLVLHIPQELMYAWGYSWTILFGQCGLYLAIMMTLQYLSPAHVVEKKHALIKLRKIGLNTLNFKQFLQKKHIV